MFFPEQGGKGISAKHKLNAAYGCGALVIAGLLGWLTGSLMVFLVVLIVVLVAGYHGGELRR